MTDIFEKFNIEANYIHDQNKNCFAYVKTSADRWDLLKVPSVKLERFIQKVHFDHNEPVPAGIKITEMMNTMGARCLFGGEKKHVHVRVAPLASGGIEIDLGYEDNTCIKVNKEGWVVHASPENFFYRPDSQQPLPFPATDGDINALRNFLNYESEEDFYLIVGFMLGAFRQNKNHTFLALQGEQGCGKTTITKVIKSLLDNTSGGLRGLPRDVQTLLIGAQNAHLLSFDNLSGMSRDMSDNFCRLATGGTFSTRQLYSNGEEFTIEARKPVIMNGIDNIAARSDLVDRCLILTLPRIKGAQTGEAEFWENFEQQAPAIMGALMDGLVSALRNSERVTVEDGVITPRTIDFAKWAEAGCRGMGIANDTFLNAFIANRKNARVDAAFMDVITMTIHKFLSKHEDDCWEGTVTELMEELTLHLPLAKPRNWPATNVALSNHLTRNTTVLESIGIVYDKQQRTATRRTITLAKTEIFDPEDSNDSDDGSDGFTPTNTFIGGTLEELPF